MKSYIATFYTHYGAMKFGRICKDLGVEAKLMPVPRRLSSSCGTCVLFSAEQTDFLRNNDEIEDLEDCYYAEGNAYTKMALDKQNF